MLGTTGGREAFSFHHRLECAQDGIQAALLSVKLRRLDKPTPPGRMPAL
jgi:hypothetical protein